MNNQQVVIGGGCFWCTEAVFLAVDGVLAVESGYSGGHVDDPSYEQVCDGSTGHAEVVRVEFDADRITLREILEIFFATHDPTTLNRQGADVGTQYRSVIFTHDDEQAREANALMANLRAIRRAPWAFAWRLVVFAVLIGVVLLAVALNAFFVTGVLAAFVNSLVLGAVGWVITRSFGHEYRVAT